MRRSSFATLSALLNRVRLALVFVAVSAPLSAHAQITLPYSNGLTSSSNAFSISNSGSGDGLYGYSASGNAVVGNSSGAGYSGVYGVNQGNGYGVYGYSTSGNAGVYGAGIYNGVQGDSSDANSAGVAGKSTYSGTSGTRGYGLYGSAVTGTGVYGTSTGGGNGVVGYIPSSSTNNTAGGVVGSSYTTYGTGVAGQGYYGVLGTASSGGYGVYGTANSANSYAVYGQSFGQSNNYAGYFAGDVYVAGYLTGPHKTFLIDHPLDPANKLLRHSVVESNEIKNLYDGVVVTDAKGSATVELPDWFEALNNEYRYQLTVLGTFAQAIVSREIKDHRFSIETDKPNTKVSWQVTGVRHDAAAKAHPMKVEEDKTVGQRGKYLDPTSFGKPESLSMNPNPR
jgi:hypothetical protein